MRPSLSIFVFLITAGAEAQSLADRIARADGTIRLSVPGRPGVCGDGQFIGEETSTTFRTYTMPAGASLDKLSAIIRNDPDPSLRRQAQRRVGIVREEGRNH